jgi:hypothetical protein
MPGVNYEKKTNFKQTNMQEQARLIEEKISKVI